MDFKPSPEVRPYLSQLQDFMDTQVFPAEAEYEEHRRRTGFEDHAPPPILESLRAEARSRGLWNLFLPDAGGLTNVDYAQLAEITGWSSQIAPQALNCDAPNSGNMEVLHLFGTEQQKRDWLQPLLDGEIRSAFAMTEPDVASSDATNISTRIEQDGDEYVINGHKWWTTGSNDPRCKFLLVLGQSDPEAARHMQHSLVIVPIDTAGVNVVRSLSVFGYQHQQGHGEILLNDVRVPKSNLVGDEGGGFSVIQARLGPGRVHHCMRSIGVAERALKLMCERAVSRKAFGKRLADQGVVQHQIAQSRIDIDMARLMVLKTAWLMDTVGVKAARKEIAAIKVTALRVVCNVLDRAIQVHGGAGVSDDFPLAHMYGYMRALRFADGPDEVHIRTVATQELRSYASNN